MGTVNNNNNGNGLGFFPVLALIFITLKLMGYITWSWWAVLAPIWLPLGLLILLVFFMASFVKKKK